VSDGSYEADPRAPTKPPEDQRPPKPDRPLKPGYQWVWVEDRIDRKGLKTAAHWRMWIKQKPGSKASQKRTPGPKPGKPRMTSPAHAQYLRDRLDVPITYFTTLRSSQPLSSEIDQLLGECHAILKMVQLFVGRFTSNLDMSDDE